MDLNISIFINLDYDVAKYLQELYFEFFDLKYFIMSNSDQMLVFFMAVNFIKTFILNLYHLNV